MSEKSDRKMYAQRMKQVDGLFERNPTNIREEMEKLGFEWFDDDSEEDRQDEIEEARATPQNLNQERLVAYFEGQIDFHNAFPDLFRIEKAVKEPNYPLFRRYFKRGNERLMHLLLQGLRENPSDRMLLSDLWLLHEHRPILSELVKAYQKGCEYETNLKKFVRLAEDFYDNTCLYGYDAFQALEASNISPEKKNIVKTVCKNSRIVRKKR